LRWDTTSLVFLGLSCCALLTGLFNLADGFLNPQADSGLGLRNTARGVEISTVVADSAAGRAGLEVGDRLLAVDGNDVPSAFLSADLLASLPQDRTVVLSIERSGEVLPVKLTPGRVSSALHSRLYLWLVGLAFLVSGTLLMLQRRRAGLVPYYLLSLAAWLALALSHTGRASAFDWSVYWLDTAARCWLPALALHCALLYPRPLVSRSSRLPVAAALHGFSAVLLALPLWLVGGGAAYRFADPVGALEATDRLQLLYLALGLGGAAAALVVQRLRQRESLVRRQLRWIEYGCAASLAPFVLFYLLPAGLGAQTGPWHSLALLPLGVLPVSCSVALARKHLADLEVILKRGVALTAYSLAVVACYLAVYMALRAFLGSWSALPEELPMLLAVVTAAALTPALRERIHTQVDRLFYLDKYDYRKTLIQFSRELNSERNDLTVLLERFLGRVVQTLEVVQAAVLLRDEAGNFTPSARVTRVASTPLPELAADSSLLKALSQREQVDLTEAEELDGSADWSLAGFEHLVPMKVKGRVVALLGVGSRAGGSSLTREDLQLLVTVSGHAAMAIEGARLYGEIERKVDEVDKLRALSEGILQSSSIGMLVVAPGGTLYRANGAAARLLGGGLEGARAAERLPAPVLELLSASGDRRSGGVRRLYRVPVETAHGRRIINATVAPLHLPEVGAGASVVTLDDVSERVELEEKLLQNERLASIGLLAAGVAHEVNTPLTGICSYVQMLLSEFEPSEQHTDLLRRVESQAFRASDIVKGLLNFARGGEQSFAPTDFNAAIEEAIALFAPHLRNTSTRIECDLAPGLPPVWGIRREIQQVIVNLLLNARDAMPRGGRIRISTRQVAAGVELQISDTGHGIPADHLHRIYDPFFTTKGVGRGTGLGLSVTYGIVRKHSGSIDVHSAPERGTVFTVSLPEADRAVRALTH
jgi:signal transduction histidine kinase